MERNGIHIIDLHKTVAKGDEAAEALKGIAQSGQKIQKNAEANGVTPQASAASSTLATVL